MTKKSVVLGFSGGIDSYSAAEFLKDAGYEVHALTLKMLHEADPAAKAGAEARRLGVQHHTLDVSEQFRQHIIDYFTQSYIAGRTPAPCTLCNPLIKWHYLAAEADCLGIEHIATGHYFNIANHNNHLYVSRAADPAKDQSYYLWGLQQHILQRVLTPMGGVIKEQIKSRFDNRRESMGLCFLAGSSYREFMQSKAPESLKRGEIRDKQGRIVGHHDGIAFYTIGQKRGFECELSGKPIVGIDAPNNRLIIGEEEDLFHSTLEVTDCNIVDREEFLSANDISVVIRGIGRNPEGYALRVEPLSNGYRIHLSSPAWAPAIGQPVVFYRAERVVGGGILSRYY